MPNDFALQLRPIKRAISYHNATTSGGSKIVAKPLPPLNHNPSVGKAAASACWAALSYQRQSGRQNLPESNLQQRFEK